MELHCGIGNIFKTVFVIEIKLPSNFDKIKEQDLGEFIWWVNHLGIGPEELLSMIHKVGNDVIKIREYNTLNRNTRAVTKTSKQLS